MRGREECLIAADLHPRALAVGWRRTFACGGETIEIENRGYGFEDLGEGMVLEEARSCILGMRSALFMRVPGGGSCLSGCEEVLRRCGCGVGGDESFGGSGGGAGLLLLGLWML